MDEYNPWGNPHPSETAKERWRKATGRWSGPVLFGVVLGLLALWILSGIYSVEPSEAAVVRQFGRVIKVTGPGLHIRMPYPIQTHDIVNIQQERRAEIGFRSVREGNRPPGQRAEEALMLTEDENIVEVNMVVQYRVEDPAAYLFNVRDPEQTLHAAAEVALRSVIGSYTIDEVISAGVGRSSQVFEVRNYLQQLLDSYGTGLRISEVAFTLVDAPEQVRDAFHDVLRALEERERKVNEAEAYRADIVPRARGEAQQILRQAEAYRQERVLHAQGDTARFLQMLEEYKKAPEVTRQRMYLETVERALAGTEMFIMSEQTQGVLPFLPLGKAFGQGGE